ncbi:MAG: pyrrolo-quinoline quinone [Phycisphaeraceae bacterium]|nr:pyrrolo-quinoline quinone [Phycisphaeraceae bacterium]
MPTLVLLALTAASAQAADWPHWGRDGTRNMVSPDEKFITDFHPGELAGRGDEIDPATTKHIKWIAKLGSNTYGNVTVANGRVYIGTNNKVPRDLKLKGDRSNIYCLDEKTGAMQWQLSVPKLGAGKVGDWEYLGICSSPAVDRDRVYALTNRCEVICLDVAGMQNGNDGPVQDEGAYMAGPGKPAIEVGPTDADIIWRYEMAIELGVFPHNVTSSSVLVAGDRLYVTTSNGVDYSHKHIINPRAPSMIALDKATGALIGEEASGISTRIMHCNWSSPAAGTIGGARQIIFGAGDGFCYGFRPDPEPDADGFGILKETWRFDCNPPEYRKHDGAARQYNTYEGPSENIASPVIHDQRVYIAIGQDPEHGEGVGALSCIDATGQGDVSKSGLVWRQTAIGRSISTVSVVDGLVYAADYAGRLYCVDASDGKVLWKHDTLGHIWGSTLVAGGHVVIGNEDGLLFILEAGREKKLVAEIEFPGPIYSSPVVANGVLYVSTMSHLFAIGQ